MRVPPRLHSLIATILLALAAPQIVLGCEAVLRLTRLHDGYAAMLASITPENAQSAAFQTLGVLRELQPRVVGTLRDQTTPDGSRPLPRAFHGARSLAHTVLAGNARPARDAARNWHQVNIDYLHSLIDGSDCRAPTLKAKLPGATDATVDADNQFDSEATIQRILVRLLANGSAAGALAAFSAIALGTLIVRQSRAFRLRQLERKRRHAINLPAMLTLANSSDPPVHVKALDISVGGMKLAWTDLPEMRSSLTIELGDFALAASVVWSNAHYVGILFDRFISEAILNDIVEMSVKRSRYSHIRKQKRRPLGRRKTT